MTITDLDNLIDYLYSKGNKFTTFRDVLFEHFNNEDYTLDVTGMLIKLDKDGYLNTDQHHTIPKGWDDNTGFKLSVEGKFFKEDGKYSEKIRREKIKYDADENAELTRLRNDHLIVFWTRRLTYATLIAALILITWEIVKHCILHWDE